MMEHNFAAVSRLLAETEKCNERVDIYKPLFDAIEGNTECLDCNQRIWYSVQRKAREQFIASFQLLREVASRCTDLCTLDIDVQEAEKCADNCRTAYTQMDFNKYEQYCTFIFF